MTIVSPFFYDRVLTRLAPIPALSRDKLVISIPSSKVDSYFLIYPEVGLTPRDLWFYHVHR